MKLFEDIALGLPHALPFLSYRGVSPAYAQKCSMLAYVEFEVARNAVSNALLPAGLPRESHFHCQNCVLQTQLPLLKIHSFALLLS